MHRCVCSFAQSRRFVTQRSGRQSEGQTVPTIRYCMNDDPDLRPSGQYYVVCDEVVCVSMSSYGHVDNMLARRSPLPAHRPCMSRSHTVLREPLLCIRLIRSMRYLVSYLPSQASNPRRAHGPRWPQHVDQSWRPQLGSSYHQPMVSRFAFVSLHG